METAQPAHVRPKGTHVSAQVPISYIELNCSCNPADDPTPVCNCWTDIESCILATLCRPLAFGLNRERAGLGKCCGSCLCYGVLGSILMNVPLPDYCGHCVCRNLRRLVLSYYYPYL